MTVRRQIAIVLAVLTGCTMTLILTEHDFWALLFFFTTLAAVWLGGEALEKQKGRG